jgi:GT2 family glycosyltransferase
MIVSMIIPTRNRSQELAVTLDKIAAITEDEFDGKVELIVIDNDSEQRLDVPTQLSNGVVVHSVVLDENQNTAARNIGAQLATGDWLLMLDDDSSPINAGAFRNLEHVPDEIGAVGGEILLPNGSHEAGGLPEVIVGCGCFIRRELFLQVGGYDQSFGFYAEEYDLCARIIAEEWRVIHDRSFLFEHRKVQQGRDFSEIIYRLTRNSAWVMARYAPADIRQQQVQNEIDRYRQIALKENAVDGFERAMHELDATLHSQPMCPLSQTQWDRFTGSAAAREGLCAAIPDGIQSVQIVGDAAAKGRAVVEDEIHRRGIQILDASAEIQVVGSLSPGVILDLQQRNPQAVSPWDWYTQASIPL